MNINIVVDIREGFPNKLKNGVKLDSVGSPVRYEMMKLCTGSV